ncbi:unnamed protein product [Chondrus crispus]|uniref:Uncharacterized protein n=1 Tax=Chondrus crispus TaxID=2769 RepID=R7Q1Z7_CHOCR|nr:unnamed protein product [Chondrus crispus]CDF32607.1 unnamed protein product [Chondrus crispus]|eukprot:XP_005712378.1 unnamed protein product [Chondrus crispus]
MVGPGGLFGRIAQWLANEVIVKGLANNPTFQRFAVRSSQKASDLSKNATEAAKTISESESLAQFRRESQQLKQQANDFASALREEIQDAVRKAGNDSRNLRK